MTKAIPWVPEPTRKQASPRGAGSTGFSNSGVTDRSLAHSDCTFIQCPLGTLLTFFHVLSMRNS